MERSSGHGSYDDGSPLLPVDERARKEYEIWQRERTHAQQHSRPAVLPKRNGVFISYRSPEQDETAVMLRDALVSDCHYSEESLFLGGPDIKPGHFPAAKRNVLIQCMFQLVLVGKEWLTDLQPNGRHRFDDPLDYLRVEIEEGMSSGAYLIPISIDGARMPQRHELPSTIQRFANQITVIQYSSRGDSQGLLHIDTLLQAKMLDEKPAPTKMTRFPSRPVEAFAEDAASVDRSGSGVAPNKPTSDSDTGPLVFLCHSSGDKERVRDLYRRLRTDNITCWFDEEDLMPGDDWDREITRAIRRSKYVVACVSAASVTKSGYVQKELKKALDVADEQPEGVAYLIPVRLEECEIPERLKHWHWVDLFKGDGYARLVRGLQAGLS